MVHVDYREFICRRAFIDGVDYAEGRWYAIVCSWFGTVKDCVRVEVTSIVQPVVREEARRILDDYCDGDEECRETYYDTALEEAAERLAESLIPEIVAKDHAKEIIEMACPDLLDALAPRR